MDLIDDLDHSEKEVHALIKGTEKKKNSNVFPETEPSSGSTPATVLITCTSTLSTTGISADCLNNTPWTSSAFGITMNELMEIRRVLQRAKKQTQKGPTLGNRSDFSTTKKMQNPPIIMPNYGKRKCIPGVPKTKVSRVLLYDNVTQQHMLDVKRANIKIEKERTERLFDLQIRSFTARMSLRHDWRLSKSTGAPNLIEKPGTKRIVSHANMNSSTQKPGTKRFAPHTNINRSNSSVQEKSYQLPVYPSMHRLNSFPMNQPELERFSSTNSREMARFPKLEKAGTEIMLSLQTKSGHRKLYYSSDESGLFLNLFPLYKFYPGVTEDPRFTKLESLLASSRLTA